MSKIAVVYWAVPATPSRWPTPSPREPKEAGAEVSTLTADQFSAAKVAEFDAIAFGCPAMGAETLEEDEFEPMFTGCESALSGKKLALFGSYGWGDGEWMRTWEDTCRSDGAVLACERHLLRSAGRRRACAVQEAGCYAGRLIPGVTGWSALGRRSLPEPCAALPDRSTTPEHK